MSWKAILKIAPAVMVLGGLYLAPISTQAQAIPPEGRGQTYYAAFPKTMTIDGNFSDWSGIPQASVTTGPQPSANPSADGSLKFAVTADSSNLYFSANVIDNNIIAGKHGDNYWNEDSVEIYINGTGNFGLSSYTTGVAQITIPAADIGLPADQAIISGTNAQSLGVRAVVVRTGNGYAVEASIPLHTNQWSITPTNGGVIGFEVELNDATQTDRDVKLSWSNKDQNQDLAYQNPGVFGQLSFYQISGGSNPAPTAAQPTQVPPTQPPSQPTNLPLATLPPPPTILPTDLPLATLPPPPTIVPTNLPLATLPLPPGATPVSNQPAKTYDANFPRTITLDGNFSDWAGLTQVSVISGPQPAANPSVDGAMTFAAIADTNNLYFMAQVVDNNIIAGRHGDNYWNEDSVEIYINATGNYGLTSYTNGVAQITIPAADIGLSADQAVIGGQNVSGVGVRALVVRTSSGYAMEVAVPLHTGQWNITPTNGGSLGFEVQLNDATQTDRNVKLSWSSSQDLAYANPSAFGRLTFVQSASIASMPTSTSTALPLATLPPPPPTAVQPTVAPTMNSPTSAGFSVQGSTIIGPDGKPFVARGVNVNGSNWVWQRSTVGDVSLIADCWGFNLIRVNSFLFTGQQPWSQYTNNNDLDAIVQTYTSRHIVVVFEAHDRIGSYYEGSDLTALVNWFTGLAQQYKNNPYVWFDVMNEPGGRNGIDANNWLNTHQQVIRAIRDVAGANNIIMIEGATGGQDAGSSGSNNVQVSDSAILQYGSQVISFGGKTYSNIVFSIHSYDLWNYGDAKMANFFDQVKAKNFALVVGEYGVQTDQNTTSAASSVIDTAPKYGIGHIVWHWDGDDYNDLTVNTTIGGGWEINSCTNPSNLSWLGLSVWIDNHSPH